MAIGSIHLQSLLLYGMDVAMGMEYATCMVAHLETGRLLCVQSMVALLPTLLLGMLYAQGVCTTYLQTLQNYIRNCS